MTKNIQAYHLRDQYETLIEKIRQCAPLGVTEAWGIVKFEGISDFRLDFGKYRVVELAPMATRIAVFMEWRNIFRHPEIYGGDEAFYSFEDAFGYLRVNENLNQPWNVYSETDISDRYVEVFLTSGMELMVKEIKRQHPTSGSRATRKAAELTHLYNGIQHDPNQRR